MADTRTRIINLPEATVLDASMNFVEDSADGSGTRRVTYDTLKGAINQEGAANLAPAYSNAATYAVGDLCTYQGKLYSCSTAISTAEDWTAAHWTAVNVSAEISEMKNALTVINADVLSLQGGDYNLVFEHGSIGGDGRPYPSTKEIRTGFIKVPPSRYTVTPNISGTLMYVMRFNSSKSYIGFVTWGGSTAVTFDIPVGSDTAYLRIVCKYQNGDELAPVDNAVILHNNGIYADVQSVIEENPSIPSYYKGAYLDEKIATIYDNSVVGSGTTFAFITDIHMADNMKSSKALMRYILDNSPVPFVISGGDIVTAYSKTAGNEKAEVYDAAQKWLDWVTYWGQDRVYQMRGNHDYVIVASNDSSKYYNMPLGGVHQFVMSKFVNRVNCPVSDYNYYYFDNETQKVRYIVIDGHTYNSGYPNVVVSWITPSQINWLIDVLNNSDGYNIVLISHEATDSNMASYAVNLAIVQTIAEAYVNRGTVSQVASGASITADFTNATGTLVCILSGHSHRDQSHYQNGVLSISTTCDAVYNNDHNVTRTRGTVSESAFDVFSIDTTAKTIKTVRIGGGSDRGWNYETGAELTE